VRVITVVAFVVAVGLALWVVAIGGPVLAIHYLTR
jgi:hypothetical protein